MNNPGIDPREPPHDIGAEQCVLGAAMLSPTAIEAAEQLTARAFYRPAHQDIWTALIELHGRGAPTGPVAVLDMLGGAGAVRGVDGPYLHTLIERAPGPREVAHYVGIVQRTSTLRALQAVSDRVRQGIESGHDPGDILERLAVDLSGITPPAAADVGPGFVLLDEFLTVEDEPVRYRVDRLWPIGGRVVAAAQYKSGKTTLRDNLVRALVDKEDFLGAFAVEPPAGRVAVIDNELDERTLRRWLREQRIANPNRVAVLPLRGKVGTFDLLDREVRSRWAQHLRTVEANVVVFDCLRPVLDALGLDEHKEAGRFLVAFDALLDEANVSEALLIHHMGHQGERSRGDSRLLDWPDVTWRLVRQNEDPASARYFTAFGRDVDQPEGLLVYDQHARRLSLTEGSRQDAAAEGLVQLVVDAVTASPKLSRNALCKEITGDDHKILAARDKAVQRDLIHIHTGPNRAQLHYPGKAGAVGCCEVRCTTPEGGAVGAVIAHSTTPPLLDSTDTTPHPAPAPASGIPGVYGPGEWAAAGRPGAPASDCPDCGWPLESNAHETKCGGTP
ncbi:AAA family ATPase [Actinomadura litoris]|uniref:AAA family ATPase n=1 Tax=Actinomadura litoris TaxID=2678616 RepID=A0A7K1L3Y4_9ACTN|nr:AAA family ATPase [Actinomadura litoris]MUN38985.1 AAA family ATPase [Actinomadura litoris]